MQNSAAASSREDPIHRLVESGVPITLNTDDPTVSNTRLSVEYRVAAVAAGLAPQRLLEFSAAAAAASLHRQ